MKIRGIKLVNETCWSTDHLWAFVRPLVIREIEREKWKGLTITFTPRRGQRRTDWRADGEGWCWCSGRANWLHHTIAIRMPTRFEKLTPREKIELAAVIAHECWHINARRGGRAVEIAMRRSVRYGRPKTPEARQEQAVQYAWAAALPLEKA
jgi:hypothetical protein